MLTRVEPHQRQDLVLFRDRTGTKRGSLVSLASLTERESFHSLAALGQFSGERERVVGNKRRSPGHQRTLGARFEVITDPFALAFAGLAVLPGFSSVQAECGAIRRRPRGLADIQNHRAIERQSGQFHIPPTAPSFARMIGRIQHNGGLGLVDGDHLAGTSGKIGRDGDLS